MQKIEDDVEIQTSVVLESQVGAKSRRSDLLHT